MDTKNPHLLPVAILIAGAILAFAIYFVRTTTVDAPPGGDITLVRAVSEDDHLIGSPAAKVVIIEYSDIDCEYCKDFQATMTQLMTEYAPGGNVAWVYRHFPILSARPDSALHAQAAECASSLGDGATFFRFIDALNQAAPGQQQFDPRGYGEVVEALGLPVPAFMECISSDKFAKRVTRDFENAGAVGGTGTPYSVMFIRGAESIPISGAIPYESMKDIIETALSRAK